MSSSPSLPLRSRAALRKPLALAALCLLGAGAAKAQSLQVLYESARSYDATYLSARSAADAAQAKADQALALRLPSLSLSASVGQTDADTRYNPATRGTTTDSRGAGVSLQQSVFNRANELTIDQADKSVVFAQSQLRQAEQDLIVRLSQAYFDVLAAADTLATVQASKKAIAEQLASAKRNFEVGTATITDTREAQARYDLSTAQELAADNDLRVKRLALEQLVGQQGVQPTPLAQPVVLPPLAPAQAEEWVNVATQSSFALEQARIGLEVAKLETEKARAGHWPTVSLTGSYARSHLDLETTTTPLATYHGPNTNTAVALTVTVPLFSGFATENRIKETLALEAKSSSDLDAARRAVTQTTRTIFFGVQSGQAQVKALEAAESSSKLALEATQLGYKVGVRVNLDVLNAQTQLFQTQRDLAKARYDVLVNGLKLRQATGQLSEENLQAVNQLLAR